MQQIQIQKLQKKLSKDKSINLRIEKLKKLLKGVQEDYQRKVYFILKEILDLRKTQIKKYSLGGLSREKGINLTIHQIMYIFGYEYISSFTKDKIDKGQLRLSTALFIIKQDLRFREPIYQNKAVKMYMDGRLKTTELSRLSAAIIFDNVIFDKEIDKANKQLINMSFSIQEYMKLVKSKQNLFSDRKTIRYIINQLKRFEDLLEHTIKFGKKLK